MTQFNHTVQDGSDGTATAETVFDQLLREEHDGKMLMGALYYAQLGFPVFPVEIVTDANGKTRKKPCVKDWQNGGASTDVQQVASWWRQGGPFEGKLIGVQTGAGSGWGVIDVDCKNGSPGFESLRRLADELVPISSGAQLVFGELTPEKRLAPNGLVRTRSGGLHLWYRLGDKRTVRGRNKIRDLPGLEFKATGHYVIVAPSTGYEWLEYLPAENEPGTVSSDFLNTAPIIDEKLLTRLLEGGASSVANTDWGEDHDDEIRYVTRGAGAGLLQAVVKRLQVTPEGQGNDTIYQCGLDLYPYVVRGELTRAAVDQGVRDGISRWGVDEDYELDTLDSAWRRTQERTFRFNDEIPIADFNGDDEGDTPMDSHRLTVVPPLEPNGHLLIEAMNDPQPGAADATNEITEGPTGGALEEFLSLLPDAIKDHHDNKVTVYNDVVSRYLRAVGRDVYEQLTDSQRSWSPVDLGDDESDPTASVLTADDGRALMYVNEKNMVWGKASAGKSWIAYLAMVQEVKAGRHVILFDYENGKKRIRSRLLLLGLTPDEIREFVHVYLSQSGAVPVKRMPVDLDQVGLVVTDSYTGALSSMDLDARVTGDIDVFCRRNVTPFTEAGACALVLDHVVKDDTQHDRPINSVGKLNRVQGSGFQMENIVPFHPGQIGWSLIRLWKDNSGALDWTCGDDVGKLVIDARDPERLKVSIDTDVKDLATLSAVNGADDIKVAQLVAKLDEVSIPRDLGVAKVREAMKAHNISANQEILAKAVRERKGS